MACIKCGSQELMSNVRLKDRGHYNSDGGELSAVVYEDPEAMIFRGTTESALRAQICAGCGFTELYAESAVSLWAAYQKAGGRQ